MEAEATISVHYCIYIFTHSTHRAVVTRVCGANGKWVPEPRGARFSSLLPLLEMFRVPPHPNGSSLSADELFAAERTYAARLNYSNYDDCLPTVTKALLGASEYAADFHMVRCTRYWKYSLRLILKLAFTIILDICLLRQPDHLFSDQNCFYLDLDDNRVRVKIKIMSLYSFYWEKKKNVID